MAETLVVVPVDGTISEMRQWGHSHRDYPSEDSRNKALQLIENLSAHTDKVINSDVDLRFSKVLNEAMVLALDKLLELQEKQKKNIKENQNKKLKQILEYQEELVALRKRYLSSSMSSSSSGDNSQMEAIKQRMEELKALIMDLSLRINVLQVFYNDIQYYDKFEITDGFREYDTNIFSASESLHNCGLAFDFNYKVYDYVEREIVYRVFAKYGIVCPLYAVNGIDSGCHMEYSSQEKYQGELLDNVDLDVLVQTYIDYYDL